MCVTFPIYSPLKVMGPGEIPEITPPTLRGEFESSPSNRWVLCVHASSSQIRPTQLGCCSRGVVVRRYTSLRLLKTREKGRPTFEVSASHCKTRESAAVKQLLICLHSCKATRGKQSWRFMSLLAESKPQELDVRLQFETLFACKL